MDLETENRIAAILLKEAAELRRQAQREGALAYLGKPTVRSRPNSRFLTATVRGVQQANRAVEVNEMWRLREKQIELDNRLTGSRDVSNTHRSSKHRDNDSERSGTSTSISSKKRDVTDCHTIEDGGLGDDEVEEFLRSRTKRGRGAVGSRMDETGPYLSIPRDYEINASDEEVKRPRVSLGPEKPHFLQSREWSENLCSRDERKSAKVHLSKRHSKKHKKSEEKKRKKKRGKRRT
ncbi:uncharacterized protein LOC127256979 [Andrographis paniculata]|uniref:uncharacterized protein LOC127256979 n=1 Tax=Andrographis paniculata TaxID=175694 RepID=UPI0021E74456|nr:uncharacterized protein LOC127256979 [Andrographis paniculata]